MNKKIRVLVAVLICCNLVTTTAMADEISDAKNKSESIQTNIESDKEKVAELEKGRESLLSDMGALDKELNGIYGEINQLNAQIDKSNKKIKDLEAREVQLHTDLATDKKVMSKRYRELYKSNGVGYLELLLESNGFADFMKRLDTVTVMAKYNKDVINEYYELQEELSSNIVESNEEKAKLQGNKESLDVSLKEVETKKLAKTELMKKAEQDLDEAEALLASNKAEFDQVLASIEVMEKEAANRPSRGDNTTASENTTSSENTSSAGNEGNSGDTGSTTVSNNGMFSITGTIYSITSPFGNRTSPISGNSEFHTGIDIGAPHGAPVYVLKDGVVTYSGEMQGYGKVVVINHGDMSTLYAHNSALSVSVGQAVSGGQQISNVGQTGYATGPHIHFEVIVGGQRVDSAPYYF